MHIHIYLHLQQVETFDGQLSTSHPLLRMSYWLQSIFTLAMFGAKSTNIAFVLAKFYKMINLPARPCEILPKRFIWTPMLTSSNKKNPCKSLDT